MGCSSLHVRTEIQGRLAIPLQKGKLPGPHEVD